MPAHLSLYLDALRFAAAVTVFLGHYGTQRISGGLFYQFEWAGQAAVDVFFVLSGFVIAHVTATRETRAADYALHRAARILSVVIPALVLTFVLDTIGAAVNPDFYRLVPNFDPANAAASYAASLLFLHQAWFAALQPGSNVPYWSMGFEVWYYAVFGVACFAPARWRWAGVVALLVLVGPKVTLLLPVWLAGVMAWRLCQGPPPPRILALLLAVAPVACLALWHGWFARHWEPYHRLAWDDPTLRDVWYDYAIGLAVVLHLIGIRWLGGVLPTAPNWAARAVRGLAGCTFGFYLFHYPVIHCLAAILPWAPESAANRLALGLGAPMLILVLAHLAERQKTTWRDWLAPLFVRRAVP